MRIKCKKCVREKREDEYYTTRAHRRLICKACVIKANGVYQSKHKRWKDKDIESRKEYSREYYARNKDKFVIYRKNFLERHPDYFRKRRQGE